MSTSGPGSSGPGGRRHHRPLVVDPATAEELGGAHDPVLRDEVAHATAGALVRHGRATQDPEVLARLVALVERLAKEAQKNAAEAFFKKSS